MLDFCYICEIVVGNSVPLWEMWRIMSLGSGNSGVVNPLKDLCDICEIVAGKLCPNLGCIENHVIAHNSEYSGVENMLNDLCDAVLEKYF